MIHNIVLQYLEPLLQFLGSWGRFYILDHVISPPRGYGKTCCHQHDACRYYALWGESYSFCPRGRSRFIPWGTSLMLRETDAYYILRRILVSHSPRDGCLLWSSRRMLISHVRVKDIYVCSLISHNTSLYDLHLHLLCSVRRTNMISVYSKRRIFIYYISVGGYLLLRSTRWIHIYHAPRWILTFVLLEADVYLLCLFHMILKANACSVCSSKWTLIYSTKEMFIYHVPRGGFYFSCLQNELLFYYGPRGGCLLCP